MEQVHKFDSVQYQKAGPGAIDLRIEDVSKHSSKTELLHSQQEPLNTASDHQRIPTRNKRSQNQRMFSALAFFARVPGVAAVQLGDDFSNNIFSDLAPILTLFGEQVAKQFMAGSMFWEDNLIFAMAPLGIITAMVGAIRIGGPPWLRAIIGRARENKASAEVELTTSTSKDVCELWNGTSIVRMMGSARILQLVFTEERAVYPHFGLFTLEERGKFTTKPLKYDREPGLDDEDSEKDTLFPAEDALDDQEEFRCKDYAPNISLNVRSFTDTDRRELRIAAAFGVLVQTLVLLFSGFATYHPKMAYKKEGESVEQYAFPLAATGTIMVAIGMFICSSIVESSTAEKEWRFISDWERRQWATEGNYPEEAEFDDGSEARNTKLRVIWLQQEGGVNDQSFDSYVLFAKDAQDTIVTSELSVASALENGPAEPVNHSTGCSTSVPRDSATDSKPSRRRRTWVLLGTFASLSGFILQFTGLRGLHWSGTISQLVGTMIMLVVRAFIRRHLILAPSVYEAHRNYELDWLATRIGKDSKALWDVSLEQKTGRDCKAEMRPSDHVKDGSEVCHCELETPDCYKWQIISGVDLDKLNFTYPTTTAQQEDGDTKRKEYQIPEPEESLPYLYRAVKIRERIGQLSNWPSPLSETAVTLASAIEVVMNTLFSKSPYTLMYWRIHGPGVEEDSTEREKDLEPIYLCVSRETEMSSWSASAAELESTLSLWLYSVYAHELGDQRSKANSSATRMTDEQGGNRMRFGHGITQSRMCVRRLGPVGGKMEQLLRKWYLGGKTANIRRIIRETSGQSWQIPGDANWRCRCNGQPSNPTTETAEKHRIVGFNRELKNKDDIQNFLRRAAPTKFQTVPYDAHDGSILCSSCGSLEPEDRELGVFSVGALELLFAQDLFASFMWTVANHYDGTVGGATTIHPLEPGTFRSNGWDNFTIRNTILLNLVNDLSRVSNISHTLGNPDDIYISVLTPFCYHRKLPIPTEIVDHAHGVAEEREGKGSWEEAGNVYRSLFSACEAFDFKHPTYLTAASLLYEHSQVLLNRKLLHEVEDSDSFWQIGVAEQRERSDFKLLENEERNCLGSFGGRSATELLLRIEGSYALQGRSLEELMSNPKGRLERQEQQIERFITSTVDEQNLEWLHKPTLKLARDLTVAMQKDAILEKFNETLSNHRYFDRPPYEINKPDLTGWTALHYVAAFGSGNRQRRAVDVGQHTDRTGVLILGNDATNDSDLLDLFTRYIRRKTIKDIDAEDSSGRSPLHYAYSEATASMLIQCGANLHHRSSYGLTPLHSAAQLGNLETVTFFLKSSNSVVGALDQFRRTPLHWAVLAGHIDIIRLLIENGADTNACDSKGRNLFHYTALKGCPRVSISEIYQCCNENSNRDMLLSTKEINGLTPLHLAAKLGSLDSLSSASPLALSVLRPGEPISGPSSGPYGLRAIHYAALYGHDKDIQLIFSSKEYGPEEVDCRDSRGATPLSVATEAGHPSLVRILLDQGANFKLRDFREGQTALSIAARRGESEIFRILLGKYGVSIDESTDDRSAFFGTTKEVMQEVVSALLDGSERKVDITGIDGTSPLLWAAKNRKRDIAKLLLDVRWVGPDEINLKDELGRTPLSHAAGNGEAELVQLLLSREEVLEKVNEEDDSGFTALHWAAQNGETNVIEILLATPSTNINAKNRDGRTALSIAVENERAKTIRALLRRDDIDVSAEDNNGHSAIWWANRADFPDFSIIDILQMRLDRIKAQAALADEDDDGEDASVDVAEENSEIGDLIEVGMKDSD